jgi:hypothetical protein
MNVLTGQDPPAGAAESRKRRAGASVDSNMVMHDGSAYADREEVLLTVQIALTRRANRYVARVSFDDHPGWETCEARSARVAFERATAIAARRVRGTSDSPEPSSNPGDEPARRPTQIWSRKP